MVRLTDYPDMTLDVYHGRKYQHNNNKADVKITCEKISKSDLFELYHIKKSKTSGQTV